METLINQLGQTVELKPDPVNGAIFANIGGKTKFVGRDMTNFFKDSEFNPVLLKDGTIIPHFKYNGQPIKTKEMGNICRCNNCGAILHDENPQIGAKFFPLDENFQFMKQFQEDGEIFWGCPNCETDNYLIDIE